jgi:HD-like signal output (HDOD) protein
VAAPAIDQLRRYSSFRHLSDEDLLILGARLQARRAQRGEVLFEAGDIDSFDYFLLQGTLLLVAEDGRERAIEAGSEAASMPVARLRPRQYTVRAQTPVEYFVLDCDVLEELLEGQASAAEIDVGYGVVEMETGGDEADEMLAAFRSDLENRRFRLTSLPEVAVNIRTLLSDELVNLNAVADAINRDPAIAAKIIRAANSPVYFGASRCDTVQAAINRLGLETTRQLVVGFTLRDLFTADQPLLRKLMQESWEQSVEVAALSFVLARHTRLFHAEEALLAGLVSSAGALVVLNYATQYPQLLEDEELLRQWIARLKGEAGALLLEHWQFPEEMVEVARHAEAWFRCPTTHADLCDLVLVATLHSYIGKRRKPTLPRIDQVPAYTKLALGKLTPELTLQALAEAREQVAAARALLTAP